MTVAICDVLTIVQNLPDELIHVRRPMSGDRLHPPIAEFFSSCFRDAWGRLESCGVKISGFRCWSRTEKDLKMEACARSRVAAKLRNLCFRSSSSSPSFIKDCEVTQRKQLRKCSVLKRPAVTVDSYSRVLGRSNWQN